MCWVLPGWCTFVFVFREKNKTQKGKSKATTDEITRSAVRRGVHKFVNFRTACVVPMRGLVAAVLVAEVGALRCNVGVRYAGCDGDYRHNFIEIECPPDGPWQCQTETLPMQPGDDCVYKSMRCGIESCNEPGFACCSEDLCNSAAMSGIGVAAATVATLACVTGSVF